MSSIDGMYMGYLSAAGLYAVALILFLGAATFPNANVLASNIIALLFFFAIHAVYANLASGMPRSGGDYVFTSRLLRPSVGFMVSWGIWVAWAFFWQFLAGSTIVASVISPLLSALGVATGNEWFTNAADGVQEWYIRIPLITALILVASWILASGLKAFLRIQRTLLIPLALGGVVIILVNYIVVSKATFITHFNEFQGNVDGLPYGDVITKAQELGMGATHSALFDTLALAVLISTFYVWTCWQSAMLGEIKQANQLKATFWMYAGAGILQFLTLLVAQVGAYWYFGDAWFKSFSWLALNYPDELGGSWAFRGVATLFYIPSLNIAVGVLLFLCFLAPIANSLFNNPLSGSRFLLAMAFDRVLPKWMGGVNAKGVPGNAIWFFAAMALAVMIAVEFVPSLTQLLFWTSFASLLGMFATLLAGLLFPVTGKSIFAVSPGAQWRVLGLPGVSFFAVIGMAYMGACMAVMLAHDGFGLRLGAGGGTVGFWAMILALVIPFVFFYIIRYLRKQEGIEVDYAFRTIPRG